MYAVVANGISTICTTQQQLDCILAIYPYPKFQKCRNKEEALTWLATHDRVCKVLEHSRYGDTAEAGYISVEYFIMESGVCYNVKTEKCGIVRFRADDTHVHIDARQDLIKVKIDNIKLNDNLILHHAIAVSRILRLAGEFVDADISVPDISVYLALTAYRGSNYLLKSVQQQIEKRLGAVSFTVQRGVRDG